MEDATRNERLRDTDVPNERTIPGLVVGRESATAYLDHRYRFFIQGYLIFATHAAIRDAVKHRDIWTDTKIHSYRFRETLNDSLLTPNRVDN